MGVGVWLGVVSLVRGYCNTCSVCLLSLGWSRPCMPRKRLAPLPPQPRASRGERERPPTERDREAARCCVRQGPTPSSLGAWFDRMAEARKEARRLALVAQAGGAEPPGTGSPCSDCGTPRTALNTGVCWSDAARTRLTFHYAVCDACRSAKMCKRLRDDPAAKLVQTHTYAPTHRITRAVCPT